MIEFLKLIIDVVSKAVPNLSARHDNKRMREIGSELFLFYIQVNEAMMTGYEIVRSLEVYVARMGNHLADDGDPYALTGGHWIRHNVQVQGINLARIGRTMQRWGVQLQIIDGEAFARIKPLLVGKRNALDVLLDIMSRGDLPISGTWEQLLGLVGSDANLATRIKSPQPAPNANEIISNARNKAISTDASWDREIYGQIKLYLELRDPKEQLDEIRRELKISEKQLSATLP